jgi:DNA-binding transcriptional LysR family regulator
MARSESPSIDDLRTLLAMADSGTETAAAKQLGITQPVVHRRLRTFRTRPALVCTRDNAVQLTDAGRDALPAIRRLLRQYDHLKQFLAGRCQRPDTLAVGVGSSATQYYLARAIAGLRERLPDWEIQTRVRRGKDRIVGVVDGTLDLAIVSHNQVQIESIARWACDARVQLRISELAQLPLCVIARRQTPEGDELQSVLAGQTAPVAMLADWPLAGLDRESGIRQQIEGLLAGQERRLAFVQEAGGWLGVREFVRQGLCVGLVPLAILTAEDQQQLVIRRLPTALAIVHRLVRRSDADAEVLGQAEAVLAEAASTYRDEVERRWHGVL